MALALLNEFDACEVITISVKDQGNKIMLVLKDPDSAMAIAAKQVIASFHNHMHLLAKESKGKINVSIREMRSRR